MPLYAYSEREIRTDNEYFIKEQKEYPAFRFIHYYEGFLLALDSLQNMGFNADVYIYDTQADSSQTALITQKPDFKDLDLIIGPFFARNLNKVVPIAAQNQTWVVSPFSSAKGLNYYSNLFVLESPDYSLWRHGMRFLKDSLSKAHLYVLHNGSAKELQQLKSIQHSYLSLNHNDSSRIHIYNYKNKGFGTLLGQLHKDRENVIINLTTSEAYISNFVRQLNQKAEDYPIVLMGLEEHWKEFKTLELEYLVKLRLTLLAPNFIDYRQPQTMEFVRSFQKEYGIDPETIAFKGFDDAFYFLNLLHRFGKNFTPCMNKTALKNIQQDYTFSSKDGSRYLNTTAAIYQYFNYQLVDKCKVLEKEEVPMEEKEIDSEDEVETREGMPQEMPKK